MLITLKTLQQQTFQVEIDDSETVQRLKEKIEAEKGKDYPAENQRLIYAGKILSDSNALSEYKIDEKKFIVVMVTKPKASPGTTQEASESTPAREQGDGAAKQEGEQPQSQPQQVQTPQQPASVPSFNNPDRAVEYLVTGIPAEVFDEPQDNSSSDSATEGVAAPASGEEPLAFLRSQPQFQQMRQVIQQNPQLLNAVLQQIGQTNPALLQLISQNQEAFVRMLNEPAAPGGGGGGGAGGGGGGGRGGNQEVSPTAGNPPIGGAAAAVLQVSPQDREAIERLKALGFPEDLVVQAYFACEKNENMAANFLLSSNLDDD
ncbi:UV excision repair protein RAD23 B [Blattella germanica]|nr:UV excision repair protein RAD23 B [Blattella germanica]